jgi:hypothetical protein
MHNLPTRSEATAGRPTVQLTTMWNDVEFEMSNHERRREALLP